VLEKPIRGRKKKETACNLSRSRGKREFKYLPNLFLLGEKGGRGGGGFFLGGCQGFLLGRKEGEERERKSTFPISKKKRKTGEDYSTRRRRDRTSPPIKEANGSNGMKRGTDVVPPERDSYRDLQGREEGIWIGL